MIPRREQSFGTPHAVDGRVGEPRSLTERWSAAEATFVCAVPTGRAHGARASSCTHKAPGAHAPARTATDPSFGRITRLNPNTPQPHQRPQGGNGSAVFNEPRFGRYAELLEPGDLVVADGY